MPPLWHSVPALRNNDLPQADRSTCRHDSAAGGPFYLRAQRCRRNCSSLLRRLLQAELIYFAATKIRIGRGNVAATTSQAGHSTCRYDGAAGGTVLVRSKDCCRRTVLLAGTMVLQAELIYFAATKIRIGRGNVAATTSQAGHSFLRHDGAATILDFRPRIGNHCSTTGHFGDFRAAILDFKPRIENRCSQKSKQGQSAHRFSI